jgi:hypothetical protein
MTKTAEKKDPFVSRRMKRRGIGILAKGVVFSWAITVGTILIFASAIITGHRSESLRYLFSKAELITTFIENLEGDQIVLENHRPGLDSCAKIVGTASPISFIAITRKDGMSVVHLPPVLRHDGRPDFGSKRVGTRLDF